MMLVLTRLTTLAAAYALPVSITASPVEEATLSPVEERTITELVTVATFMSSTLMALLLRQVRSVHSSELVPGSLLLGDDPGDPAKKYERSQLVRSMPPPRPPPPARRRSPWRARRSRPSRWRSLHAAQLSPLR